MKILKNALVRYRERILDPETTPSARMLREMRENKEGFYHFALRKSLEHDRYFRDLKLSKEKEQFFTKLSEESIQAQIKIEVDDKLNFDEFLAHYFKQTLGQQPPYSL
mgnify:CR=1 FL=1